MHKIAFKINNNIWEEYTTKPVDYSDEGVLYYRENDDEEWQEATPPAYYRARQDCYEKFGKEAWLDKEHADSKKKDEMIAYFNKQVKLYEQEEKTNEK